jgi:hypothetical protein
VFIGSHSYFLPFPYTVFLRLKTGGKWIIYARAMGEAPTSLDSKKYVHRFPLSAQGFLCLDMINHYAFPSHYTFDEMITTFWSVPFPDYLGYYRTPATSYKKWQSMSIDKIVSLYQKEKVDKERFHTTEWFCGFVAKSMKGW